MGNKWAVLVLGYVILWQGQARGMPFSDRDLDLRLDTRVQTYDLSAGSFAAGLVRVASDFHVPMGIAWIDTDSAKTKLTLHWRDTTLRQIIATIAKSQPGYEVHVSNGVVHVYVKTVSKGNNFLFLAVKAFSVHREPVQMAERKLKNTISSTINPIVPGQGGIGGTLITKTGEPKIDVQELRNVMVQDVLDTLATISRKKVWIVTFSTNPVPTPTGFRRTLTLWNNFPVSDDQQPVWDMFGWDEPLPSSGPLGR